MIGNLDDGSQNIEFRLSYQWVGGVSGATTFVH